MHMVYRIVAECIAPGKVFYCHLIGLLSRQLPYVVRICTIHLCQKVHA